MADDIESAAGAGPAKKVEIDRGDEAPAAMKRSTVVVVLGVHRSGTSTAARALQALGVDLGDNLMAGAEGENDKGFFEDLDVYRLNERLLKKAGSSWHDLRRTDPDRFSDPLFSDERREAMAILAGKLSADRPYGFKDPRTALLLPFWRCVFDDLEIDDRYLIVHRNPLNVAASLHRRNAVPMAKGVLLWARHLFDAIDWTCGRTRCAVSYDRLVNAPVEELFRLREGLQFASTAEADHAVSKFAESFVSADLRHHVAAGGELRRCGFAPSLVLELNDIADGLTRRFFDIDENVWSALKDRYEAATEFFYAAEAIDAARREALKTAEKTAETLEREKDLRAKAEAQSRKSEGLNAALADERKTLQANLSRAQDQSRTLERKLEEVGRELAGVRETSARERESLEQKLRLASEELDGVRRRLRTNEAELGAARRELKRAQADASKLKTVEQSLRDAKRRIESLSGERERLRRDRARLAIDRTNYRRDLLRARVSLKETRASSSWRLTAPLRWAVSLPKRLFRRRMGSPDTK